MIPLRRKEVCRRIAYSYQLIVSLFIAGVFLVSSLPHLTNSYYFLSSVFQYKLVGATVGELTAIVLPFLQLCVSICLLTRIYVGGSLLVSSGLFLVFTIIHASVVVRSMSISCGCFGPSHTSPIGIGSVLFVGALFVLSLSGYVCFFVSRPELSNSAAQEPIASPTVAIP